MAIHIPEYHPGELSAGEKKTFGFAICGTGFLVAMIVLSNKLIPSPVESCWLTNSSSWWQVSHLGHVGPQSLMEVDTSTLSSTSTTWTAQFCSANDTESPSYFTRQGPGVNEIINFTTRSGVFFEADESVVLQYSEKSTLTVTNASGSVFQEDVTYLLNAILVCDYQQVGSTFSSTAYNNGERNGTFTWNISIYGRGACPLPSNETVFYNPNYSPPSGSHYFGHIAIAAASIIITVGIYFLSKSRIKTKLSILHRLADFAGIGYAIILGGINLPKYQDKIYPCAVSTPAPPLTVFVTHVSSPIISFSTDVQYASMLFRYIMFVVIFAALQCISYFASVKQISEDDVRSGGSIQEMTSKKRFSVVNVLIKLHPIIAAAIAIFADVLFLVPLGENCFHIVDANPLVSACNAIWMIMVGGPAMLFGLLLGTLLIVNIFCRCCCSVKANDDSLNLCVQFFRWLMVGVVLIGGAVASVMKVIGDVRSQQSLLQLATGLLPVFTSFNVHWATAFLCLCKSSPQLDGIPSFSEPMQETH